MEALGRKTELIDEADRVFSFGIRHLLPVAYSLFLSSSFITGL